MYLELLKGFTTEALQRKKEFTITAIEKNLSLLAQCSGSEAKEGERVIADQRALLSAIESLIKSR